MNNSIILWLMTGFIIKHFICDFPLQRKYQWQNKWQYGHPGGIVHAAIHATGTFIVMVWISLPLAGAFALADVIIHYHIDWLKAGLTRRLNLTFTSDLFWVLFGVDQLLHYLTYILYLFITP